MIAKRRQYISRTVRFMASLNTFHCETNPNLKVKVVAIILVSAYLLPLLMFNGSIDNFQLLQGALSYEVSQYGYLSENYLISELPAFYAFGAIILDLTGISSISLNFFPIQIVPLIVLLYAFFYRVSGNNIFAGLITLTDMISGTTGTFRVYFWPHGIGYIIFLTIFLVCILLFKRYCTDTRYYVVLIIALFSLVFICYNYTAMSLLFLVSACFCILILGRTSRSSFKHISISGFLKSIAIALLGLLGISGFVYNSFIPLYDNLDIRYSTFDKVTFSYFEKSSLSDPFIDLLVSYPFSFTILSILKYGVYLAAISAYLLLAVYKYKQSHIDLYDVISLSIVSAVSLYMIPRILIGDFFLTNLYFLGLTCLSSIYRLGTKLDRKLLSELAFGFLLVILLMTPITYTISYDYSTVNSDENHYSYTERPAKWLLMKADDTRVLSDELTKNSLIAYSSEALLQDPEIINPYISLYTNYKRLSVTELLFLINRSDIMPSKNYYVANLAVNHLCLGGWTNIVSWCFYIEDVNSNQKTCSIYDSGKIRIYT